MNSIYHAHSYITCNLAIDAKWHSNSRYLDNFHLEIVLANTLMHVYIPLSVSQVCLNNRGRLAHHRHFTFKSGSGEKAVTLMTDGVDGAFADEHQPFAYQESWLQIYLGQEFCQDLLHSLEPILSQSQVL